MSKESNLICFLLLMCSNVVFDAFKLHFQITRSKHPKFEALQQIIVKLWIRKKNIPERRLQR